MQLALLQALDLELVEARRVLQCSNRGVEVAMLLLQSRQLLLQLTLFLFGHQLPEIAKRLPADAKSIAFYPCSFKSLPSVRPREGVKQSGDCCPASLKSHFESG